MKVDPRMVILVQSVLPPSFSYLQCLQGSYVLGELHRAGLKLDSGFNGLVLDYPEFETSSGCRIHARDYTEEGKIPALEAVDLKYSVYQISAATEKKKASTPADGLPVYVLRIMNDISHLSHLYLPVRVGMCYLFDLGVQSPTPRIPLQLTPRSE